MASQREKRERRERAGSGERDAKHRAGGEWTTLTIPEGVDIWQPKAGNYKVDIVPFKVGEGNPFAKPGKYYYERTFFTHRGIGPNNESHVCLAKTFGEPCPVCEYRAKMARDPDADPDELKSLKPKERQLWLIHDRADPEKGVQLWEFSFFCFGKLLDKRRQDAEEDEPHITNFDDADAGATLRLGFAEKDAGGYSFLECYSIDFKPRPNGLPEELLDHGICLDELVKKTPYDRLKAIFLQIEEGEDDKDDDDEDEPKGRGRPESARTKRPKDDDDDEPPPKKKSKPKVEDDDWSDDDEEDKPVAGTGIKGNKAVKDAVARGKAAKKSVDEEDDDEDELPPKKKSASKAKDEDEDDWDADLDEEEEEKLKPKSTKSKAKPKDDDEDDWD